MVTIYSTSLITYYAPSTVQGAEYHIPMGNTNQPLDMYHCIDFSPKPSVSGLLLLSSHFRDEDPEVTCPKSHGEEVVEPCWRPRWSTPYLEP